MAHGRTPATLWEKEERVMINKIGIFLFLFTFFNTATFADAKTNIYSKLKCCLCKEKIVENCVCPKAKEMKAYIYSFLDMGLNEEGIFIKVAKKYSLDSIIDKKKKEEIKQKLIEEAGSNRPEIFIRPLSYNLGRVSKAKGELENLSPYKKL